MKLTEIDLKGYGWFSEESASFRIDRYHLPAKCCFGCVTTAGAACRSIRPTPPRPSGPRLPSSRNPRRVFLTKLSMIIPQDSRTGKARVASRTDANSTKERRKTSSETFNG